MAGNLIEYFKSVFTMEDVSILPVLETNFEGREPDSSLVGSYQMTLARRGGIPPGEGQRSSAKVKGQVVPPGGYVMN